MDALDRRFELLCAEERVLEREQARVRQALRDVLRLQAERDGYDWPAED